MYNLVIEHFHISSLYKLNKSMFVVFYLSILILFYYNLLKNKNGPQSSN